jgi:hypothetical protein
MGVLKNTSTTKLVALIKAALATKVDKESGKGLSTNDYTDAEKSKLASLSASSGGQVTTTLSSGMVLSVEDDCLVITYEE